MQSTEKAHLYVREWLAIGIVIVILGSLVIITSLTRWQAPRQGSMPKTGQDSFDVLVKGAIAYPGVYHFDSKVRMGDLLELAGVNPEADLRPLQSRGLYQKGEGAQCSGTRADHSIPKRSRQSVRSSQSAPRC